MIATLSRNPDLSPSEQIDIGEIPYPVIRHKGQVYVLRSYVVGFVDNASRQDPNGLLYIRTEIHDIGESH